MNLCAVKYGELMFVCEYLCVVVVSLFVKVSD